MHDQGLAVERAGVQLAGHGTGDFRRCRRHQPQGHQTHGLDVHVVGQGARQDDRDIRETRVLAGARVTRVDLDVDARMVDVEVGQAWREQFTGEERRHHDRQLAPGAGRVARSLDGRAQGTQCWLEVIQQLPANGCQHDGPRSPLEQRDAELFFEFLDLVADGRGRQRQAVRRILEARVASRDAESSQQP